MKSMFLQELEIDPDQLDVEWLRQPSLLFKYSNKLEKAKEKLSELKNEREVIKSDVQLEIRQKDPEDYGVDKFTESIVNSLVLNDKRVQSILKLIRKK
jgi:hypothetical protein